MRGAFPKRCLHTIDDIFEKNLLMLIPFYIFSREAEFSQYETDSAKLETLKDEYRTIIECLDKLWWREKASKYFLTLSEPVYSGKKRFGLPEDKGL